MIPALIYALCIVAFLVAVRTTTLGQDAYDPGPRGDEPQYPFFDRHSLWHLAGAALACVFALWLGVPWGWALALTIVGGLAYEAVNGTLAHRGSWYDVVWDTMGALLAVGLFGGALHAQDTTLAPPSANAHPSVIAMWGPVCALRRVRHSSGRQGDRESHLCDRVFRPASHCRDARNCCRLVAERARIQMVPRRLRLRGNTDPST